MNMPHPGELRERISILTVDHVTNPNGYTAESETTLCTVWAGVANDTSRFFNAANADQGEKSLCFIIRWRDDVREGMYVRYAGERYLITEVFGYDFKKRYQKLTAKRTEAIH